MSPPPTFQSASLSVPVTASTTTYGPQINARDPSSYDKRVMLIQLHAMDNATLDVVLQESWDNGTTWDDVAHFPQLVAGSSTPSYRLLIGGEFGSTDGPGGGNATTTVIGTAAAAVPVLPAGSYAPGPWAKTFRIVATTGTGTSVAAQTQTIQWIDVFMNRG